MPIASDTISEATRRIIRSASVAGLERARRRSARIHRLLVGAWLLSTLLAAGSAIADRETGWLIAVPFVLLHIIARRNRD